MDSAAALLVQDLREQWRVIDEVHHRVDERRHGVSDAPASVEGLAYQLHNLYGACEQLFRHFFRHAYAVELEPGRVEAVAEAADRIRSPLRAALDRFAAAIVRDAP